MYDIRITIYEVRDSTLIKPCSCKKSLASRYGNSYNMGMTMRCTPYLLAWAIIALLPACQPPLTLEQALLRKDTVAVEAALRTGAPCNAAEVCNAIWDTSAPEGITEAQRVACLDSLLKHRPELLRDSEFCEYAMERAVNFPCAGTLEYLLKKGVPATLVTNGGTGWTLLDYAISIDFKVGEALLRQYGATEHPNADSCVYPDFDELMKNL